MSVYSKSISQIVADRLNKTKSKTVVVKNEKKEQKEAEQMAKKEQKEAERIVKKEQKEAERLAKKEQKNVVKEKEEEVEEEEEEVKKGTIQPPSTPESGVVDEAETVTDEKTKPVKRKRKVKTIEKVEDVKKQRKAASGTNPPKWFLEYNKQMELARGNTNVETIKESAKQKWEEKGMPERVVSEREKHVGRMYTMMFGK